MPALISRGWEIPKNTNTPALAWSETEIQCRKQESGKRELKGVQHVAGEQSKDGHDQNCFQLFVVRGIGATVVIAAGFLRVILDGQPFAHRVRGKVLGSVMTKLSVIHPIAREVAELYLVVAGDTSEVIMKPYPLTRVHGCVSGGPGFGRPQFPK